MTTRITGPNGETINGIYWPPRYRLTVDEKGLIVAARPATTWETTSWQIRHLVRRLFP